MRITFLGLFLILFASCNKISDIKFEKIFDKKDSIEAELKEEPLKEPESKNENVKRITTSEAPVNLGKNVVLTGHVAQVTKRSKVSYLNFDYKYPKHTFTGVIFAGDYGKFDDLSVYEGKDIELKGMITEYNGKPQMIINSPEQIKIIN